MPLINGGNSIGNTRNVPPLNFDQHYQNDLQNLMKNIIPVAKDSMCTDLSSSHCALVNTKKVDFSSEIHKEIKKVKDTKPEIKKVASEGKRVSTDKIQNVGRIQSVDSHKTSFDKAIIMNDKGTKYKKLRDLEPSEINELERNGWQICEKDGKDIKIFAGQCELKEGKQKIQGKECNIIYVDRSEIEAFQNSVEQHINYLIFNSQDKGKKNDDEIMEKQKQGSSRILERKALDIDEKKEKKTVKVFIKNLKNDTNQDISRKLDDKKHEAYIEYANKADELKKFILNKNLKNESIITDAIQYSEMQKAEKSIITNNSFDLSLRKFTYFSNSALGSK